MAHKRTALVGGALVAALLVPSTANAASSKGCDKDCQAQNQVRGEAVNLGFPFPVPAANRFPPEPV